LKQGLAQPGFMANYNFLVPWELAVSKTNVSSLLDKKLGRKSNDDHPKSKESSVTTAQLVTQTVTLRVYIGMEYECPLGHRFVCSGPDRLVRASANGTVKVNSLKTDLI
jgi:protein SMG8